VPLSAVAEITRGVGPLTVNHFGQLPAVTLSVQLNPGYAIGDAVDRVTAVAREDAAGEHHDQLPGDGGRVSSRRFAGLWLLLILSIVVIYIVLGILYESFVHPLTILSGLPSAGFGALLTLMVFASSSTSTPSSGSSC